MYTLSAMLTTFILQLQLKIEGFFKKEDGEVNIIAIVVLIGIALLLALLFKNRISQLINALFDTIDQNAQNAIN